MNNERRLKASLSYRPFDGKPVGREIGLAVRKRSARLDEIRTLAKFLSDTRPDGTSAPA